jgi:hypothetical protein
VVAAYWPVEMSRPEGGVRRSYPSPCHGWAAELEVLWERIGPRFGRIEVHRRTSGFLCGLLSAAQRKNGWQLAEQAGDTTPTGCSGCSTTPAGTLTRSATT